MLYYQKYVILNTMETLFFSRVFFSFSFVVVDDAVSSFSVQTKNIYMYRKPNRGHKTGCQKD